MVPEVEHAGGSPGQPQSYERATSKTFWRGARDLYRWRRFILVFSLLAAAGAAAVSYLLPVTYKASTTVVLPRTSGRGQLSAILGELGSVAATLLGGGVGDYTRYLSILESRGMMETVVDTFGLIAAYETGEAIDPMVSAVETLRGNVDFYVDAEFEFLRISVFDPTSDRAANMADFFVAELNRRNATMMSDQARTLRRYVEERYEAADSALAAARDSLQSFQEAHGLVQLEEQTEAFLKMVARYRADAILGDIEYEALKLDYGEESQAVIEAGKRVQAARGKERQLLSGTDALLPVDFGRLPAVARRYSELMQEVLIESAIVEFAGPLVEQVSYDEQKQAAAVQVLDSARVPVKKARPLRAVIILATALSALLLAIGFALLIEWWRRHVDHVAERLSAALARTT